MKSDAILELVMLTASHRAPHAANYTEFREFSELREEWFFHVLFMSGEWSFYVAPAMPWLVMTDAFVSRSVKASNHRLERWHHPNVVDENDRPSGSETFRQLAEVLVTGDIDRYRPSREPNTHWVNWPDGGSL